MTAEPVPLFAECPVPKCSNPVDDGRPCASCSEMIASGYVREVPAPEPMTVDQARDELEARRLLAEAERKGAAAARAAAAERGEQPKANQVCWCCEERRTCRRDPDFPDKVRWICKECEGIS